MEKLRGMVAGMNERERKLAAITLGLFVVFVVFVLVYLVGGKMSALEDETASNQSVIDLLLKDGPGYKQKLDENAASDLPKETPPPLRTLIDKIGRQVDLVVPDMNELPDQSRDGGWIEHGIELSMREIDLVALVKFMEEVENHKQRFPIAITKLEIQKRRRVQNSWDVGMIVSTYEKSKAPAPSARTGAAGKGRAVKSSAPRKEDE